MAAKGIAAIVREAKGKSIKRGSNTRPSAVAVPITTITIKANPCMIASIDSVR